MRNNIFIAVLVLLMACGGNNPKPNPNPTPLVDGTLTVPSPSTNSLVGQTNERFSGATDFVVDGVEGAISSPDRRVAVLVPADYFTTDGQLKIQITPVSSSAPNGLSATYRIESTVQFDSVDPTKPLYLEFEVPENEEGGYDA